MATLQKGMSGNEVKALQTALKNFDSYMFGHIVADGIFGSGTETSVRIFQQMKGLTADGVAGPSTLAALGLTSVATSSNTSITSVPTSAVSTGGSFISTIPVNVWYGLAALAVVGVAVYIKNQQDA